jgi:hypothetical protein
MTDDVYQERVIILDFSQTFNIAIGCVMASLLNMEEKQEVIEALKNAEAMVIKYEKALNEVIKLGKMGANFESLESQLAKEVLKG